MPVDSGVPASRMRTLARVPLPIVDDFGLKPSKAGQDEDLRDLVVER